MARTICCDGLFGWLVSYVFNLEYTIYNDV